MDGYILCKFGVVIGSYSILSHISSLINVASLDLFISVFIAEKQSILDDQFRIPIQSGNIKMWLIFYPLFLFLPVLEYSFTLRILITKLDACL